MLRRASNERRCNMSASSLMYISRGKKIWSEDEDEQLRKLVELHGTTNWTLIGESLPGRTGKQCRERFHNHLDFGIKKGDWTEEEDRIILVLQREIGNQWAKITKLLPGRTDNAVKNRFHATERAKSRGKLNDAYLNDPVFTAYIVREAMRVNGEFSDETTIASGETDFTSQCEVPAIPMQYFPVAPAVSYVQSPPQISMNVMQAVPIPPQEVPIDDDAMSEDHSLDALMEIDIISFEDEDEDLEDDSDSELPPNSNNFEIDPGCFNFDFAFNGGSHSHAAQPAQAHPHPHKKKNLCGLESWVPSSMQHKTQAAVPVQAGEQFIAQTHKTQLELTPGEQKPVSAWSFSSSHHAPHPPQSQQQVQKQHSHGQNFPPLTFTAFGSVTTFFCSR